MKFLKNTAAILLAGVLLLFAVSCNNGKTTTLCKEHVDADQNGACDICGEKVEISEAGCDDHIDTDGDNLCDICDAIISEPVSFTVTVKKEDGSPLADAQITLFREGEEAVSGTTNAEGVLKGSILPGAYTVSIENVPAGWLVEGNGKTLNISAENGSFEFKAIDNNPDGSEEKPFFVGEEPLTKVFPAGGELHFDCKGSEKYLVIKGDVKVHYNDEEYLPVDGEIRILIAATSDTNTVNRFSVVNTSATEASITVTLEALPGTAENPFEGKLGEKLMAIASKDTTVYYKWTADKDGYFLVESESENNHIMLYNTTSFVVTRYTDGAKSVFVAVKKGDVVSVAVASKTDKPTAVNFTMTLLAGTAEEPLPLYASDSIRLSAGATIALGYHGGNATVSLSASGVSVALNGTALETADGKYTAELKEGDILTLTSTATENADVTLNVTAASL